MPFIKQLIVEVNCESNGQIAYDNRSGLHHPLDGGAAHLLKVSLEVPLLKVPPTFSETFSETLSKMTGWRFAMKYI
jgi:hypothetical protein